MLRELRFNPGNICECCSNGCPSQLSMWSLTQPLLPTDGSDRVSVERLSALHKLGLNAFNVPLPWKAKLELALQNISAPGGYLDQLENAGLLQFASTCKHQGCRSVSHLVFQPVSANPCAQTVSTRAMTWRRCSRRSVRCSA